MEGKIRLRSPSLNLLATPSWSNTDLLLFTFGVTAAAAAVACCGSAQAARARDSQSKSGGSKTFDSHASGFILHTHKHLDCTYFPDGKVRERVKEE